MEKLCVRTRQNDDGKFLVDWAWRQGASYENASRAGTVTVTVADEYQEDRAILAELRAIYLLLEEQSIHGENRLGTSMTIEVSAGAIRKTLAKGANKSAGKGVTSKNHVARASNFLATKYFEAQIVVGRWKYPTNVKEVRDFETTFDRYPVCSVYFDVIGEDVIITRHAMLRAIARVLMNNPAPDENDLTALPDRWWATAWRWFEKVGKAGSEMRVVNVPERKMAMMVRKYQCKPIVLHMPHTQAVLILKKTGYGTKVLTVLRADEYNTNILHVPKQYGQSLRKA